MIEYLGAGIKTRALYQITHIIAEHMNYKDKYKAIRPFVTFKIDLRRAESTYTISEKRMISRYFNGLFGVDTPSRAIGYQLKTYKPRSQKNKDAVKKAYGYSGLKLKAIPIPVMDKEAKIRVRGKGKNKKLKIREFNVSRTLLLYDIENFIADPFAEIDRLTDHYDKNTQFSVLCGQYEYYETFANKAFIGELVEAMQNRYANHEEWMRGLAAYSFDNQSDMTEYRKTLINIRKKGAKKRQAEKRKTRYAQDKKKNRRR